MTRMPIHVSIGMMFALAASGQSLQTFRTDYSAESNLVLVPVTVTDRNGAFIDGLKQDAFSVSEDGVGQPIRSFSEDDAPVSVGIVLDTSGSMISLLRLARKTLRGFAALSNPTDEAFMTTVSTRPRIWSGFTGDIDWLFSEVAFEGAKGSTALIDTVWVALDQFRPAAHTRKALLVLSDGIDNHSRHSRSQLLRRVSEMDVQIYAVCLDNPTPNRKAVEQMDAQHGMQLMEDLASHTGGLQFLVYGENDAQQASEGISEALRNQYNIGYVPGDKDRSGRWRRIRVKVARAGLKVYSRRGYRLD